MKKQTNQTKMHKTAKALLCLGLAGALVGGVFAGCSAGKGSKDGKDATAAGVTGSITVVSREEGSGTRGAFVELMGIEEKDAAGNKIDNTTTAAEITNSTAVMLTTVAGNKNAIGYVSLGSLNDTVQALTIDGVEPTAENVKDGNYKVSRPFNIVTKDNLSAVARDFVNYMQSADGQKIIEDNHYVSQSNTGAFKSSGAKGKVLVAGSSSVTPVMEKLAEAYQKINAGATVEVQQSDSTTGITSAADGTCDIGMASRELKDTETAKGVTATVIAMDGVAVIVNKANPLKAATTDTVRQIYTGNLTDWANVK